MSVPFNPEAFAASFGVALSKLASQSSGSISKTIHRLRVNFYQRYLDETGDDDCEESLLRFFALVEEPTLTPQAAIIESATAASFAQNATHHLEATFKNSSKDKADIECNIAFYEAFKNWLASVEEFRNVLNLIALYVEDVSLELLRGLEKRSGEQLTYRLKFPHLIYLLALKALKFSMVGFIRFTHQEPVREFIKRMAELALMMLVGAEAAKTATKVNRVLATGLVPISGILNLFSPLDVSGTIEKFFDGQQSRVRLGLMREELRKSGLFFRGARNQLLGLLQDYARWMNLAGRETQASLDKKIALIRTLEALMRGDDFDVETLERFIRQSDVVLTEVGRGWQELEFASETSSPPQTDATKSGREGSHLKPTWRQ